MLKHDGLPVPNWDAEEVAAVRRAVQADPSLRRFIGANPFDIDDNRDGWLSEEECIRSPLGFQGQGQARAVSLLHALEAAGGRPDGAGGSSQAVVHREGARPGRAG